jgi:hypothetical protein
MHTIEKCKNSIYKLNKHQIQENLVIFQEFEQILYKLIY